MDLAVEFKACADATLSYASLTPNLLMTVLFIQMNWEASRWPQLAQRLYHVKRRDVGTRALKADADRIVRNTGTEKIRGVQMYG